MWVKAFYDIIAEIDGDVIEAGIHWGYGLLSHLHFTTNPYKKRIIYAFDSFKGHSNPNKKDKSGGKFINFGSSFAITKDDVYLTLDYGTEYTRDELNSRIKIIDGWAQDTMTRPKKSLQLNIKILI